MLYSQIRINKSSLMAIDTAVNYLGSQWKRGCNWLELNFLVVSEQPDIMCVASSALCCPVLNSSSQKLRAVSSPSPCLVIPILFQTPSCALFWSGPCVWGLSPLDKGFKSLQAFFLFNFAATSEAFEGQPQHVCWNQVSNSELPPVSCC